MSVRNMQNLREDKTGREKRPVEIRVWDPLVRIFHWSLVSAFAIAFLTGDELDRVHELAGYIVAALIVFRIVWGFIGSFNARFSSFVRPPSVVIAYLKDMMAFRARRYLGHNPAAGAMIVALLAALAGLTLTGWMLTLDAFWGMEWVEELHEGIANFTLFLVILHVAGVIFTSFETGENLVRSMITGRKRAG